MAFCKHGLSRTMAYRSWIAMIIRCTNQSDKSYRNYGGRGITVCDRWLSSVENFVHDMGRPPYGESLDRIDVNGNYEPSNCRWANRHTQSRNKQNSYFIEYNGKRQCLQDWANELGIRQPTLHRRVRQNISIDLMFSKHNLKPINVRKTRSKIAYNGKEQSPAAWAKELGIPLVTILHRYSKNRPLNVVFSTARLNPNGSGILMQASPKK